MFCNKIDLIASSQNQKKSHTETKMSRHKFTNSELVDIILVYGECGQNGSAAKRRYAELFPGRHLPSPCMFSTVVQRVRDTGVLQPVRADAGREKSSQVIETEDAIFEAVENNPTLSTRQIARDLNVPHSRVWRTLKGSHISRTSSLNCQKIYALEPDDYPGRVTFCQWFAEKYSENADFPSQILFTDEACFTRDGLFSIENQHQWSSKISQNEGFLMNIWVGITGNSIIGPFILPDIIEERTYLNFLKRDLQVLLEEMPYDVRQLIWFQHDGGMPYFTNAGREYLSDIFEGRLICRAGSVPWPSRSPDLNPVEFFFWGYMKQIVYQTEVGSVEELKNRIQYAGGAIKEQNILEHVQESLVQRVYTCVQAGGSSFHHLL